MNERIQEIRDQAVFDANKGFTLTGSHKIWTDLFSEKFAELVVKECMDIVSKQTTLDTNEDFREGFSHGRKLAWAEIRKHFGVEE
jgi:hypothetical protein